MKPQIAEVEWVDTCASAGWVAPEHEPMRCRSVGYLIASTRKSVVLAGMVADKGVNNVGHTITIPRGCVKKVKIRGVR